MQKRAASNAADRCGLDTTTATDGSPTSSSPVRWSSATRARAGQRAPRLGRDLAHARGRPRTRTPRTSSPITPSRPSAWSRTTPRNATTAPAFGMVAHAVAASTGRTSGPSATQSDARRHERGGHDVIVGRSLRPTQSPRPSEPARPPSPDTVARAWPEPPGPQGHERIERPRAADSHGRVVGTLPEMPGSSDDDEGGRPPPHPARPSRGSTRRSSAPPDRRRPGGPAGPARPGAAGAGTMALAVTAGRGRSPRHRARARRDRRRSTPSPDGRPARRRCPSRPTPPPSPAVWRRASPRSPPPPVSPRRADPASSSARTSCSPPARSWRRPPAPARSRSRSGPATGTPPRSRATDAVDRTRAARRPRRPHATGPARCGERGLQAGDWVAAVGRTAMSGPWVTSGVVTATAVGPRTPTASPTPGLINDEHRGVRPRRAVAPSSTVDGHIVGILAMTGTGTRTRRGHARRHGRRVAAQLTETGTATHGALGVRAGTRHPGPEVTEVVGGSSAARRRGEGRRPDRRARPTATPDTADLVVRAPAPPGRGPVRSSRCSAASTGSR